jgi:hypothetical protein
MPLTTYAELKDAAARWTGYGDSIPIPSRIANAVIDSIALAETDVNDTLRVPEMIKRSLFSTTGEFVSAPSDIAKLINVGRLKEGKEISLRQVAEDVLPAYGRAYAGDQEWFALVGLEFRFAPAPTVAAPMSGRITYYGNVEPLSSSTSCTATFRRYPNVWLYGTLKHLAHYTDDDAKQAKWAGLQAAEISKANRANVLRDASL